MENFPTAARLPISSILNMNPAWMRDDLGDLEELATNIKDHGLQLPVLLLNDWQLIDGARRVEAARKLGWQDIPVIINPSWEQIKEYFVRVWQLDAAGFSVKAHWWPEIASVANGPLREAYRDQRTQRARETRRGEHETLPPGATALYVVDTAAMLNVIPADVRSARDIESGLVKLPTKVREQAKQLCLKYQRAHIELSQDPRTMSGINLMRTLMRDVGTGRVSLADATALVDGRIAKLQARRQHNAPTTRRLRRQFIEDPDLTGAAGRMVIRIMAIADLADSPEMASDLDQLSSDQAASMADMVQNAVMRINRFKRSLANRSQQVDPTNPTN